MRQGSLTIVSFHRGLGLPCCSEEKVIVQTAITFHLCWVTLRLQSFLHRSLQVVLLQAHGVVCFRDKRALRTWISMKVELAWETIASFELYFTRCFNFFLNGDAWVSCLPLDCRKWSHCVILDSFGKVPFEFVHVRQIYHIANIFKLQAALKDILFTHKRHQIFEGSVKANEELLLLLCHIANSVAIFSQLFANGEKCLVKLSYCCLVILDESHCLSKLSLSLPKVLACVCQFWKETTLLIVVVSTLVVFN